MLQKSLWNHEERSLEKKRQNAEGGRAQEGKRHGGLDGIGDLLNQSQPWSTQYFML